MVVVAPDVAVVAAGTVVEQVVGSLVLLRASVGFEHDSLLGVKNSGYQ